MTSCPEAEFPELGSRLMRGGAAAELPAALLEGLLDPLQRQALDALSDTARQAARAEGYAVGWAQGRRAADEVAAAEEAAASAERARQAALAADALSSAVQALTTAAAGLEARAVVPAAELADAVVAGAFELAQALLGRELAVSADPGRDAILRALTVLPEGRPVTARLHPDDAPVTRVGLSIEGLGRDVLVFPDPTVERGGAIVDCDSSRVDAQLGSALERVREVLAL